MLESQHRPAEQQGTDLDRTIAALIFQLSRHLATTLDRHLTPFNITGQQAALLLRSCVAPHSTPTQLAPWLGTDNAGMTRLLDRLEAKGLVQRRTNPLDRRAIVVELTPAGRALVPRLVPVFGAVFSQLLDGFTVDELHRLQSSLCRMLDNVDELDRGDSCG
jgi:DNA-binding MarR family transcriptional regulator